MKNEGQRVAAPGDRGTIPDRPSWHTLTVEDVLRDLQTAPTGLTSEEATRRLDLYGANALTEAGTVSAWKTLAAQFKNALILILLGATVVSAFLGHTLESAAIAAIVLFAVFLGFIQEYRAERAMDALRAIAAPTAHVLRDDEETCIAARELVPGDVILLRPGDRIPADARVTQAINLACDESSLTGESIAVEKTADSITEHLAPIAERRNLVFAGTLSTSGRGHAVVVATAMNTEFGQISGLVQVVKAGPTPLQQNLDRLGRTLGKAALVVVALIVVAGVARGLPLLDMFIFGVALAVAVVPEALPAVVTISLAIGVRRMVKRNALVRHLPVVETLGSTAVICTDKTGTLTKNEMTVRRIYAGERLIDVTGAGYEPAGAFLAGGEPVEPPSDILELLRAATLCSDAGLVCADERWQIRGDPTEGALIVAAQKAGIDTDALQAALPRVQEIPFTSERRQMTTLHRAADETVSFSKGASEVIIENCAFERVGGGDVPLDAAARTRLQAIEQTMTAQGLRVLAVACKTAVGLEDAEHGMTFLGYVAMMDPPRPEVAQAVQTCERAGITTVMITGDHPLTAQTIASELGILNDGRVVSGRELAAMTDEQLARDVEQIRVYARVSPADKLRIVAAWQARGHVVAMTGDGINDAPALKKADVGIAMGITGTDVSREAAGMTLLDDNFASIEAAIEEGRIVFGNIKKYLSYLLSSNVGEILLMAGAMLAGLPLPLTAVQILYVNLATDGLPALALAVDPPEADLMKRKPRNAGEGVFTRPVVVLLLAGGIWSALVNLSLFMWLIRSGRPVENAMAMTFVSLVLIQFFKAYNFRSDRASVLERPFANRWLNLAVGWELVLLAVIIYTPVLQRPFGTYSVPFADWAILLALSASVVPILELVKWSVRRGWLGVPPK